MKFEFNQYKTSTLYTYYMEYKPFEHDRVLMHGGKILTPKEINRAIRKKFVKPAGKFFTKAGTELGKFTNDQLLPAITTIGMPLASEALGMLGAEVGIPPQLTSTLSQNIMKEFIPKQYQSKNKYVNLLSSALSAGMSDNPMDAINVGQQALGTVASDIMGKKKSSQPSQQLQQYDPQNPFDAEIQSILNMYSQQQPDQQSQQLQPQQSVKISQSTKSPTTDDFIDNDNLAMQKKGSVVGLYGEGIRKKRKSKKQPKQEFDEENPLKFKRTKNSSLEQYLKATKEKEEKKRQSNIDRYYDRQHDLLDLVGIDRKFKHR